MGGKHLKRLRAEKSKVQLKKKKLSKPENITNTAFTVKKILAVEQLRKVDKNEPVSNWNVPLKDLLIRLNHYNITSRLNSLIGIKELLTKYPEILGGPSLKLLISRLLELVTDEEHKIRVTAMDVLSYLFDLIPQTTIAAFQKLMNLHLGCAMTHRNASIQLDSLKLIDVMIKYSPDAIKSNFKSITQNFMRIMKAYFYESHAGVFSSGRSKLDLEKRKREMLLRFYQFIITGYPRTAEMKQSPSANNSINVFASEKVSLRDLNDHYKRIPDLSIFQNTERKENLCDFSSTEFKSLCSLVIPLLFDTWIEYCPQQKSDQTAECVLAEGAGELLSVLLRILLFLYEMAVTLQDPEVGHWFMQNYSQTFKKSFAFNFPYLSTTSNNTNGSLKGFNVYLFQNLIICYLAYSLKAVDKNSKLETKIEKYVSGATTMTMNQEETEILLKVIKAGIQASKNKPSNIFSKVVASYDTTGNPEFRRCLSKILANVALEETGTNGQKDESITIWMKSLPVRLCLSHVFVEEVESILKLVTTSTGAELLREIEHKAEEILKNLQNIQIQGIGQLRGQRMIADILYRCGSDVLMGIVKKKLIDGGTYHPELKSYISDIFSHKLGNHLGSCGA